MAGTGGKRSNAGRKKGIPNKSTLEIKQIIHSSVDFQKMVKALEVRSIKGSEPATRLLFEYGYGKPKELVDVNVGINAVEIAKVFSQMVSAAGSGEATQDDSGIQD
jgi:hypothetical protein